MCKGVKESKKISAEFKKLAKNIYKKGLSIVKKDCGTKQTKTKEECKNIKIQIKYFKKLLHNYNDEKQIKKKQKFVLETCKKQFCNEGCKGTIFEDGLANKLPKSMIEKYKNNQNTKKLLINQRKKNFGNKKSVLKDNFFEGIKTKEVKKHKKEGAISGCFRI